MSRKYLVLKLLSELSKDDPLIDISLDKIQERYPWCNDHFLLALEKDGSINRVGSLGSYSAQITISGIDYVHSCDAANRNSAINKVVLVLSAISAIAGIIALFR